MPLERARKNVRLEMVHLDDWNVPNKTYGPRRGDSNQQGTYESGRRCDRYGVDIADFLPAPAEGLIYYRKDSARVLPGGYFGNDAPVDTVQFYLRGDYIRKDPPAVLDDGGRGLVTGSFYSKKEHAL